MGKLIDITGQRFADYSSAENLIKRTTSMVRSGYASVIVAGVVRF